MATRDEMFGVAVCGAGWCGLQHMAAFQRNPHTVIRWVCGRDVARTRAAMVKAGLALPDVRITSHYDEVLAARDVDIISIATPNHLHAGQAVASAHAARGARPATAPARRLTDGHEWPTSIIANLTLAGSALGHVTSSSDFMLPYTFVVELMGDRATLRQDLLQGIDAPLDFEALAAGNPFPDVRLRAATDAARRP